MFSEELEKYSWEDTTRQIYSKTTADVETALEKEHPEKIYRISELDLSHAGKVSDSSNRIGYYIMTEEI